MDSESLPTPEIIDPRQQTLHRFFKSTPSSAPSSHTTGQSAGPIQTNNGFVQPYSVNSPGVSMGSDDNCSPSSRLMGADMDMDVDMDSGSDQSHEPKGGVGGFRWM